jgi:hypothetical protein
VYGWEATGFHTATPGDLEPDVYTEFTANEQCFGCHGTSLPGYFPDIPAGPPEIGDVASVGLVPDIGACNGYYTLEGIYFGDDQTIDRKVFIRPTSAVDPWEELPILSWTSTRIEFQVPCWLYDEGNYGIRVITEVGASNVVVLKLRYQASVTATSPADGPCRTVLTIQGDDFENFGALGRDTGPNAEGYGEVKVVAFSASMTGDDRFVATVYGSWSDTSFQVLFGDVFLDEDGDYLQDLDVDVPPLGDFPGVGDTDMDGDGLFDSEPLLRQCEDTPTGDYSIYVKTLYYEDLDASSGYSHQDLIHQITTSDPGHYFNVVAIPAVYAVFPSQIERSHYCPGPELVNSIVQIYGWGFGADQGDGQIFIGAGYMYPNNGVELTRTHWTSLKLKAAVDVGPGAKGKQTYIWVKKNGQVTDANYGWPGLFILNSETCP